MYLLEKIEDNLKKKSLGFFLPITFILTIIPLIVRLKLVKLDDAGIDLYAEASKGDFFSQYKAIWLAIFSVILIIIALSSFKKLFKKRDKTTTAILICTGIFLICTFLSAMLSQHKEVAFFGFYDRAEGFITIACYMIIFLYSIYAFKSTHCYKYMIIPILIVILINSFLGIFQYIGNDLINSKLGIALVVPSKYKIGEQGLGLLYEKGKLYGTLYHYNYVGSFVGLVLPILFSLTIFEKKVLNKVILGVFSLLSVWLLFGSTSRAGIIGILVAIILGLIIFGKVIFKSWKPLVITLACVAILAIGGNVATKGQLFQRVPSLVSDIFSVFNNTSSVDYRAETPISDIKHVDKDIEITVPKDILKISFENGIYVFRNSNNETVQYDMVDGVYKTNNENFKNISFRFGKSSKSSTKADFFMLQVNNNPTFMFKLKTDNSIHLRDANGTKYIDVEYPETFGFKGKEKLGSARGYIWSRSIPIMKETLLLGNGPDTFAYIFPQNDLMGKYYAYGNPNMIVDKPHNLYMQIALNDGVIALIAFLGIMLIYIIDSIKLYALKKEYNESQILGGITCLGIVGYLFAGMFNDSVISVAPMFWIILGVGVSLNYLNKKRNQIN
ncbi:O-antigen ligase family protein [Clostridium taeniosporum]|uniref:O-antigen ligase domain-containing protein n=1 Tax=Clostridium taeniosporum TaxID=394958 RepID=A0A1D7XMU9_9CLOT|nr:O-antigen ligase family protein [Clostridium taeniosporum]AOR24597.1 O-antigen ligase domain-containing protein [Clostridium taeniosporum]